MCYHQFWSDQYSDRNAWMLSASLIQLEYASKQWKSTFSYFKPCSGVNPAGVNGSKLLSISGQMGGASGPLPQWVPADGCETCRGLSILSLPAVCVFTGVCVGLTSNRRGSHQLVAGHPLTQTK